MTLEQVMWHSFWVILIVLAMAMYTAQICYDIADVKELLQEPELVEEEVTVEDAHGGGIITDTADDEITVKPYTDYEVYLIARTIAGEALITESDTEMAAVAWCILNRVDSDRYPNTIEEVVTQENQFVGYWRDKEYKANKRPISEWLAYKY